MPEGHDIIITNRARAQLLARLRVRQGAPGLAIRLRERGGGQLFWLAFDKLSEIDTVVADEGGKPLLIVEERLLRVIDNQILDCPNPGPDAEFSLWPFGSVFGFRPTVLVTGATGFVGSHVIRRLGQQPGDVRALVRSPAKGGNVSYWGARPYFGDVRDRESLQRAMRGVDVVVHLVAVIRERGETTFRSVNVEGTRNVVEAARKAGVRRFIHMSALGASNNPKYRYTHSKWQGEEIVRESGLDYTILRPSVIYGEGFGFVDRLLQSAKMTPPLVPVPGSGRTLFQPIWVGDVVSAIEACIRDPKTAGQTIEFGGPERLTFEQMLDAVMEVEGLRRVKLHAPVPLMKPAVWAMQSVLPDPPVTLGELAMLAFDNVTDLDSAERHFGFKPRPFREGIAYLKEQSAA